MVVAPLDGPAVLHIAMNLREWDRREIFASRQTDDPYVLTDDTLAAAAMPGAIAWLVGLEKPIAVIGMRPMWPGVVSAWCYGTDDFELLGKSLTKLVVKSMIPQLLSQNQHRAECRSIEGHDAAHRWLEKLGFVREGTLKDCGRNRETFHLYGWRLSDHEGVG